jgi:16S rRNA (uracil1498-N3)-methyltransferase
MAAPYFYEPLISKSHTSFELSEESSKHAVQVLRMEVGETILLTNGKGGLFSASITIVHKKHCQVSIVSATEIPAPEKQHTIAVSPLKNNSRIEWFLEKATELGIQRITPLICQRTEKQVVKQERWQQILIAAMLQSQQAWLPILDSPTRFTDYVQSVQGTKLIAHCLPNEKQSLTSFAAANDCCILIGPEGDFTEAEIDAAISAGFQPVSLGSTRLRTETAALTAAVVLQQF